MGRWTPKYHDEVLITKIENIVAGVVQRQEDQEEGKTKQSLSYESFVQNIEEGDPFTTSIIEILVKELADRQTRPSTPDRESLNARTVRELHRLASQCTTYRPVPYNRARNRSSFHVATDTTSDVGSLSWFGPPARSSYDSMDEDDFDDANEHLVSVEGTRLDSSHLYDVYRQQNAMSNSRSRQTFHALRRHAENNNNGPLFGFPTIQAAPSTAAAPATSLPSVSSNPLGRHVPLTRATASNPISRQRVVRRARPQPSEFSDFSARRRSAQRSSANEETRAQESSSSLSSGTTMLAPVRSPLQTVPPIIPPPPSSSTSPISPTSPHASFEIPQVFVSHGSPPGLLDRMPQGTPSSATVDGDTAPGSNVFYSTALSNSLTRANSFADRRLPMPRFYQNYVPPQELLQHRPRFHDGPLPVRSDGHITGMDDFTAMFRDDFERDFGAWFSTTDDIPHSASAGSSEMQVAEAATATTRETSEPAANLPTPRSISPSPPENP